MSMLAQAIAAFGGVVLLFYLLGLRRISNDRVGIIEKRVSSKGSVSRGFIALDGEAGYQPRLLRGGLHWFPPFVYKIHRSSLVTIPQGRIGYVFARDGIGVASNLWGTLGPYISPRAEEDPVASKRVELYRLPLADNQATVRLRFTHAGTDSWYWGIDNVGLYSLPGFHISSIVRSGSDVIVSWPAAAGSQRPMAGSRLTTVCSTTAIQTRQKHLPGK